MLLVDDIEDKGADVSFMNNIYLFKGEPTMPCRTYVVIPEQHCKNIHDDYDLNDCELDLDLNFSFQLGHPTSTTFSIQPILDYYYYYYKLKANTQHPNNPKKPIHQATMHSSTPTPVAASKAGATTPSTKKTENMSAPVNAAQVQCTCECGCRVVVRFPGGNLCERCNLYCQ
ncbi:hypothetical protein ACRALDRAFT_205722 [Sodiomyces alcalophilus JCM 7366]|uniref:uncharacterized protein n=1 Tax=Sodiomyces alcalophilus JCM 7366 TaxID=591952 RepID=UPI0039B45BDF